jgi:ABC-type oligopeptide transport system ATPase subunit
MQKILIMGLPGSGKTTLAKELVDILSKYGVTWLNADEVRKNSNDWDFSTAGRIRQAQRMSYLARDFKTTYVIADFVCPLSAMREIYSPDWVIWMDTIESGRFEDTNAIFEKPSRGYYDFRISEFDAKKWAPLLAEQILKNDKPTFDWKKPTVQMLGRWQPWHQGHHALFERAIAKTGQVAIMVRDCHDDKNPFLLKEVTERIYKDLDSLYNNRYIVYPVPNIVNITYGRDVGYKIEQEHFDESITSISATKIRKEMGL